MKVKIESRNLQDFDTHDDMNLVRSESGSADLVSNSGREIHADILCYTCSLTNRSNFHLNSFFAVFFLCHIRSE